METTEQEHRKAATRLTSGDGDVTVTVVGDGGVEEKRTLSIHKYAKLVPLITPGDLDRLLDDVKEHGVIEPLVVFENEILDGRNRLAVAAVTGAPVHLKQFDGTDAEARSFVWSANAARRHLTIPQLALAAERFGFITEAKAEAARRPPNPDGSTGHGAPPWAHAAAKRLGGGITPHTLQRFDEARISEAPDTMAQIDAGKIRRMDIAVKEAIGERSVREGRVIEVPPPVPRTPWDRLGCARGDVLAAERAVMAGDRGMMTKAQFSERAREIQAALIRIQSLYRFGEVQDRR